MKKKFVAVLAATIVIATAPHAQSADATTQAAGVIAMQKFDSTLDALLIAAVNADNARDVSDLLARNANPNAREDNATSTTALGVTAALGHLEISKLLVEAGADLESVNSHGQAPLLLAALAGKNRVLAYLLQKGANPDSNGFRGFTALMLAAASGNAEGVHLLLCAGANVNARSEGNGTALILGSSKTDDSSGNLETVKLLVESGADLFVTAQNGKNALTMAQADGLNDIADYLRDLRKRNLTAYNLGIDLYNAGRSAAGLSKNPSPTPWSDARKLLEAGVQGTVTSNSGENALFFFAMDAKGFDETISRRLIAVSNVNIQQKNGATALHMAAQSGNQGMVALLIAAGAKLSVRTKNGKTPLDLAQKFPAIVAMLRDASAKAETARSAASASTQDKTSSEATPEKVRQSTPAPASNSIANGPLDQLDDGDHTLLMLAALKGEAAQVAKLLKDGATVDIANSVGETALFGAAYGNSPACVKLLLEAGADINHLNSSRDPIIVACAFKGSLAVMKLLIEAGADRKYLQSAILQAKDGENTIVVEYLSALKAGDSSEQAASKATNSQMRENVKHQPNVDL